VDGFNLAYAVAPETFADLSTWSRPSCRGAGATSGITRRERCARSSTAKVARGSAQIIQQSGSAILPICPAVDERVGRGLATPPSAWTAISRSWREISYSLTSPKGDRGFESCSLQRRVAFLRVKTPRATPRLPIAVCGHAASGAARPFRELASTRPLAAVCDRNRSPLPSSNAAPNKPAR